MLYRSHVNYKQRLLNIGLLPLCHWHEFLDLVQVFKCLDSLDPFISVMNSTRPRRNVFSKGTLLNTIRANTVTFENSFYCRAPRIWNTLAAHLRNTDCSVANFKKDLFNYYFYLAKSVYDVDTPQTFKSVCIKCPTSQSAIEQLARSYVYVVNFLSMSSPILFLHCVSFFFVFKVLSFLLVVLLIFFSFFFFWTSQWSLLYE